MIEIKVNAIERNDIELEGHIRIENDNELLPPEMAVVLHKMYNANHDAFLEALDMALEWVKEDNDND